MASKAVITDFGTSVDPKDLTNLYKELKAAPGKLQIELRKGVVAAAQPVVDQAKANAATWSKTIPSAIKAKATFYSKSAGVTVVVSSAKAKQARAYEHNGTPGSFRVPVFRTERNPDTWVARDAKPFFYSAIDQNKIEAEIAKVATRLAQDLGFAGN